MSRRVIAAVSAGAGVTAATVIAVVLTRNSASARPQVEPTNQVDAGLGPLDIIEDRFEVEFKPIPR